MPPKREPSQSGNNASVNNINNNNETPTTSNTNNLTLAAALTLQNSTTNSSTIALNNSNTIITTPAAATTATAPNNTLPVLIPDAAAEQRTVAYQANSKLCRLVRKCPWMYDRNHHNYGKKHILDKSWYKIAIECNDSVASCKERWRNIRAAFARSINIYKTHSGPNRVKPYYLHKELSFLVKPMMEGRDKKDDFDETQEGGLKYEDTNAEEEDHEEYDDDDEEQAEGDEGDSLDDSADIKLAFEALKPDARIQAETNYQKMLTSNSNNNGNEPCNIFEPQTEFTTSDTENEFHFPDETHSPSETERKQNNRSIQNASLKRPMHLETETFESKKFKLSQNSQTAASENDIKFLEALLPDLALMNTRQKIVFKRKVYQTLEEVFENTNDFPNIEQTKMDQNKSTNNINNNLGYNANAMSLNLPQVKQTILTVNSSTARNLINNIANLNEAELQRVNDFLQNSLRSSYPTSSRLTNGTNTPSTAAAKLMSSTPKITITKVACPPPASLRSLNFNKPPSPSPNTVSTTIHHNMSPSTSSSNVHSTTPSNPGSSTTTKTNGSNVNQQHNISPWNQVVPITIKDEIEDVDIV